MVRPLLLAPAGSLPAAAAAFEAGADVVYAGLKGWSRGGARRELEWNEVQAAQKLAAASRRKLQIAINTIPRPPERARLFRNIPALLEAGIEEVIVNDIGILAALKRRFRHLRVTAGIGCGGRTVADVAFFRAAGADAVVLPGTVSPEEMREIKTVRGIAVEIMIHMVEEFVLLGKCWMPSYSNWRASPLPAASLAEGGDSEEPPEGALAGLRQTGSMKRGGVGACYRICQQPWKLYDGGRLVETRLFPSRQISRVSDVRAYSDAGVDVFKLQGRSLPVEMLVPLVRSYREAIDRPNDWDGDLARPADLPAAWAVVGR